VARLFVVGVILYPELVDGRAISAAAAVGICRFPVIGGMPALVRRSPEAPRKRPLDDDVLKGALTFSTRRAWPCWHSGNWVEPPA
jgi:hypothetical protein